MRRYDIIITGKLLDGVTAEQAAQRLSKLFKTSLDQAARLVDGKPHRIKKDLDEASARKFKTALTQVGLQTVARASEAADAAPAKAPRQSGGSIDLAPPGTPVLLESERVEIVAPAIDLSGLSLAELEAWEGDGQPEPEPLPAPEFGLAPPGADIDTLPDTREKLNPDISALDLDEPGATLGPPRKDDPPPPDTSHIKLEKNNPFT